jgi:hypothetical protein
MKVKCDKCGFVTHRPKDGMKHTGCRQGGVWVKANADDVAVGHKAAHVRQPKEETAAETETEATLIQPKTKTKKGKAKVGNLAVVSNREWIPDENYFLWSRGAWRGWAVAAKVDEIDRTEVFDEEGNVVEPFLKLEADYGKIHECLEDRIRREVREGKTYIIEPVAVIELLQRQMLRLTRTSAVPVEQVELLESVLLSLADCAAAMEAFKAAQQLQLVDAGTMQSTE